ncbi:MAG TPA: CDP-diacylglycerol--glycerol-3-phosphate 3-phosphatidyltransferase [Phycicoccus sp.]|nr:CDP-diacylglycerol--glycerol-3-phosphate 3-phosphatidyltransferase [Phycicoccus sp.]HQY96995.1 CDP-diacylglycerol--glycerol-3-phosphate 3-phosphatidyltransferase [Phycicoccus sp.]HRA43619.1 CDP-diacylglycerol--glycerol-3-phosphate 3-phosphatidyltransferase [Phycicoccus sp.]
MSIPDVRGVRRVSAWNIANYLTVFRIVLVPVFGWLLLADGGASPNLRWWAFACFTVAMITDRLDGDLARSRGLVTDFGKVVDPIADKALVTMALVGLSIIQALPWWITVVILVREWGVTAIRFWVIRHGIMAAGRGGKLKTFLQALGLGFFVMPLWTLAGAEFWHGLAWVVLVAALIVTVVTGIDYVVQALRLRQTSPRAELKRAERARRRQERQQGS